MTDVALVATIIAFFVVAALLVRALGPLTAVVDEDDDDEEYRERPSADAGRPA